MTYARKESRARLGVFVVSGLVLAAAGVVALGAGRLFEKTVPLHCYFQETVQGLEPGSAISYRGVQVGRVDRVLMRQGQADDGLSMGHQAVIEVVCDLFPAQLTRFGGAAPTEAQVKDALRREVMRGLRVRVAWKDITGQKFLDLDYVDPESEDATPPQLGFRPDEPYIPTRTEKSLTDIQRDLATTLGSLAKIDYAALGARLQLLLEQLTQKVSEFRADEISASFRDAAVALKDVAANEDLRRGLARVDDVTKQMEELGRRANHLLAKPELESGIDDLAAAAKSLRETADGLAGSVPETLARIDGAVEDARKAVVDAKLPETTSALRGGIDDVSGAARGVAAMRDDLHQALRQLADASRSIGRLAEYLERHPEALLSGRGAGGSGGGSR